MLGRVFHRDYPPTNLRSRSTPGGNFQALIRWPVGQALLRAAEPTPLDPELRYSRFLDAAVALGGVAIGAIRGFLGGDWLELAIGGQGKKAFCPLEVILRRARVWYRVLRDAMGFSIDFS